MSYAVFIQRRAQRELADLPVEDRTRIAVAMRDLGEEPRPQGCRKLTVGKDGVFGSAITELSRKSTTLKAR